MDAATEKRLVFGQAVFSPLFTLHNPSFCHPAKTFSTLFQNSVWYVFRGDNNLRSGILIAGYGDNNINRPQAG